jgi:hypothetical protein
MTICAYDHITKCPHHRMRACALGACLSVGSYVSRIDRSPKAGPRRPAPPGLFMSTWPHNCMWYCLHVGSRMRASGAVGGARSARVQRVTPTAAVVREGEGFPPETCSRPALGFTPAAKGFIGRMAIRRVRHPAQRLLTSRPQKDVNGRNEAGRDHGTVSGGGEGAENREGGEGKRERSMRIRQVLPLFQCLGHQTAIGGHRQTGLQRVLFTHS